jgi:hypothetical protein
MPTIDERKFELKQNSIYVDGNKLNNYDRVEIKCDECGKEVSKEVKRFKKFYKEHQKCLCRKHQMEFIHMMKYGVKNCMMNENIQKKAQQTQRKNNNGRLAFNTDKQKHTMIERYGVEYSGQSKELLEKAQKTNLNKYGNICSLGNEKINKKAEQTKLKKYGNRKYNNYKKAEKTNLKRYGVKCNFYDENFRIQSMITKEENNSNNNCKWYEVGGQKVQGKFELKVAEFLIENNIKFIAHKNLKSIYYFKEDNNKSIYFPDIYLPKYGIYLEPHTKYYWNEDFEWKMKEVKKQINIIYFDEDYDLSEILEIINAYS